jgi:stress response protein SCP2
MPTNVFHVEDRKAMRVIFAGRGIGERYMVLYRNLQGGEGSHKLRIRQNLTDQPDGTYPTMSEALTALWRWVRERQRPDMVVVEGEME